MMTTCIVQTVFLHLGQKINLKTVHENHDHFHLEMPKVNNKILNVTMEKNL